MESVQLPQEKASRRLSFVDEFSRRTRQSASLYVIAIGSALLVAGAVTFAFWPQVGTVWYLPVVAGAAVLYGVLACIKPAPVCPNCNQNITTCPPVHCHVCGEPLNRGRCEHCGVDVSWTIVFRSVSESAGNQAPITCCPGCGVLLQSNFHRHIRDSA